MQLEKLAERFLKKSDIQLFRVITKKHLAESSASPRAAGLPLTGSLKNLWNYHFHFSRTQWCIIYKIKDKEITILVISIGKRDQIYKRAQKLI